MTTPNPAPDERANGWRAEYPYQSAGWTAPESGDPGPYPGPHADSRLGDPAGLPGDLPAFPGTGPAQTGAAVGRAYIPAPPFPHEPLVRTREVLLAIGVAVVVALAGFPLGWLWSAVAPKTPVQMISDGAVLSQPEQEQMIADEGWYLFLTVLAGVLAAGLVWAFLRRYRGVPMLLGLSVGGVVSGSLAAWFGHHIGYAHFKDLAQHAPVGTNFLAPVSLRVKQVGWWHGFLPYARGDVLAMAIAVLVVYLLLAAFSAYPSLRGPDPTPVFNLAAPGNGYPAPGYSDSSPSGAPYGTTYPSGAGPGGPVSSDS